MHIFHTADGMGFNVQIEPYGTCFIFDATELPIVERIVSGFLEMYEGEEPDTFYYQLRSILNKVRVSHTKEETQ